MKQAVFQAKRVIADKEREKNYQRHITNLHKVYDKDNGVQETINSIQDKLDFQHKNRQNNAKYKQDQEKMKIQKENKKLLTALIDISENDKAAQQVQEANSLVLVQPSSKMFQKQMEVYKIQNENFQLAYRMVNLPSVYPKKSFDSDYKLHKRRVAQLQKFQPEQSFDPFQSHFSSKSTHRSSSPMSRSYMFMNNFSKSNKKIGQTFYAPQSTSANKSFAHTNNHSSSPAPRMNEPFNFMMQQNSSSSQQVQAPVFNSNDRYYGEPLKESTISPAMQNNLLSNRNTFVHNNSVDKRGVYPDNSDNQKYSSPPKNFASSPLSTAAPPLVPLYCITPSKLNRQDIKLVMKIFSFSLKIKPRTDDQNDHFYFLMKMPGNSKKSTPFFKYDMMQQLEFSFHFKIRNNKTPFSRKNSDSHNDEILNDNQSNRNSIQHQVKCSLVQNKGNEIYVIGHFYLDIDASKKGINEIDVPIYQKDEESSVIGQTKVILHVDMARTLIRKKTLKQHELSDTYQVPLDQSPQQSQVPNSISKLPSPNISLQSSIQGQNLSAAVSVYNSFSSNMKNSAVQQQQQKSQSNQFHPSSENSTLEAQIKGNNQSDNNYQSSYNDFGYHPKPDNFRQFKSSSVEKRSQIKGENVMRSVSHQRNNVLSQYKIQNNQKSFENDGNSGSEDNGQNPNLDIIEEYSQKQKRQPNSSQRVFRNTFLDNQISSINKDILVIKQSLQQTTSSQNQKESLIKIHALKNRLKQIKVELGSLEQQTLTVSPKSPKGGTQHTQKRTKNSSTKKKVPQLALSMLQKETI